MRHAGVFDEELAFAVGLAVRAGEVAMSYFRASGVEARLKGDGSPVTRADEEAEAVIRSAIEQRYPRDGVLGEEGGERSGREGDGRRRWVIDPIDGTRSFAAGVPLFGCMVGLQVDGENVVGAVNLAAMGEVYGAAKGGGAWRFGGDGEREVVKVREVEGGLSGAVTVLTCLRSLMRDEAAWIGKVSQRSGLVRGWGDCVGHMLVASGRAQVMIDSPMKVWDVVAIEAIVREAGGVMVDWEGAAAGDGSRGVVSASSAALVREVLGMRGVRG